jgi:hypothetical protein
VLKVAVIVLLVVLVVLLGPAQDADVGGSGW